MPDYAILILASANRVYAEASLSLTVAELRVFAERALGGRIGEIAETRIGGVPYVTFTAGSLSPPEVAVLSNLSCAHALFAREGDLLRPVEMRRLDRFDSDLLSILKYSGKTNEQFTKLLLNLTVLAGDAAAEMTTRRLRILDPMSGRGTTLNQALMYGYDAAGIDIDAKDFDAYAAFLPTWLKHKRLKHRAEIGTIRRDRVTLGRRLHVVIGATKEEYRAGTVSEVTVINADTRRATDFFRPAIFDALVTDAPYGVQHGSRSGADRLSRGPVGLLAEALPGWVTLLRPGGALGISWNSNVARREDLAEALTANGLEVLDGAYAGFRHRVDQAIVRDLIVARRPSRQPLVTAARG